MNDDWKDPKFVPEMSPDTLPAALLVGAMKRVAQESIQGLTIEKALLKVANEILYGIKARESGTTKVITQKELITGKFIGDLK